MTGEARTPIGRSTVHTAVHTAAGTTAGGGAPTVTGR